MRTLAGFVRHFGGKKALAKSMCVTEITVTRWLRGDCMPQGISRAWLEQMGVQFEKQIQRGLTLTDYVAACGSHESAAARIGVSRNTVEHWLSGKTRPEGQAIKRLKRMGIRI